MPRAMDLKKTQNYVVIMYVIYVVYAYKVIKETKCIFDLKYILLFNSL